MKKRIIALLLALCLTVSMFSIQANAANETQKTLNVNWNNTAAVGNQSSNSVACGCYALAYSRTILDGTPRSWSTYNYNRGGENNACAWWSQGGYSINRFNTKQEVFLYAISSINVGRPCIVYVTGKNSKGKTYQHYVAIVGYTNVTNLNSLSESNFLFIDSVPGATKKAVENLGTCSRKYTLRTESGKYKYISTNNGGVSTSSNSAPAPSYNRFPACASHHTSIVTALKSIGADSSYSYRCTIASKNNISGYRGTAAQNIKMLSLLKSGALLKP